MAATRAGPNSVVATKLIGPIAASVLNGNVRLGRIFVTIGIALLSLMAAVDIEPQPAKTDDEVWALARKVGTRAAYGVYRRRFPQGTHSTEAVGLPSALVPVTPPAPPIRTIPVAAYPPQGVVDPCTKELERIDSAEAKSFLSAQVSNRVADYRDFAVKYPTSACRQRAEDRIAARARIRALFPPIPGFGPLAPHARIRNIFSTDDYPVSALRNDEQGRVTAEWDVAEDGVAESCRIIQSSGSARLDIPTCRTIIRRMRYDPARDANGVPTRSQDRMTINWILPNDPEPEASPAATSPR
jgi:TonB family protein